MATYVPPKRGVEYIYYHPGLVSQANTKLLQTNPTLAVGDVKISKDGGALANIATLPVVTPAGGKAIKVTFSAAEMTADNVTIEFSDVAGAEWCDVGINIPTSTRQVDDLAYPATSGRSMVVDAAGLVDANTVKVGPTGAGTAQTAGDIMADTNDIQSKIGTPVSTLAADIAGVQSDTNDIQTRIPAALVSGRIDASVGGYASGQDPATFILVTPANKLATDGSGRVTEVAVDGYQKNTAFPYFKFLMVDSTDHVTPKTGLTVTAQRSIDDAAFAACANSVTELAYGWYKISLAATDLNGDSIAFRFSAAGADDRGFTIKTNS